MGKSSINTKLVEIALNETDGTSFEKFAQEFYAGLSNEKFVPLGGVKDGGADGYEDVGIYEGDRADTFYQMSIEEDFRKKIKSTVKRIKEVGRNIKSIIYVSSRKIKMIDMEEDSLENELKVRVRIRDATYIISHINDNLHTRSAFNNNLSKFLDFLDSIGKSKMISPSSHVSSPAVFVFLRQEFDRREGSRSLLNALADGLILWALEDTDPEKDKFLTPDDVLEKISQTIPAARSLLSQIVPNRLRDLSKIPKKQGRPVRRYKSEDKYCLAYEGRNQIQKDNMEDEALVLSVLDIFKGRIVKQFGEFLNPKEVNKLAQLSLKVVQRMFEAEGLEFAAYLKGEWKDPSWTTVSEQLNVVLDEEKVGKNKKNLFSKVVLENIRSSFYSSESDERLLYAKLSATYTLLFCLNTEPRIVKYFEEMGGDFFLFIGSDIIIDCLSERFLRKEDQVNRNALRLIRDSGSTLILTEPVLDEIHGNLKASDMEYKNKYTEIDPYVTIDFARNIDKILIRAFFCAKLSPPNGVESPKSWSHFINQFCDYKDLHSSKGKERLKRYIMSQLNMEYFNLSKLEEMCDIEDVQNLTNNYDAIKSDPRLAYNDALMTYAVYCHRELNKENSKISEFGFKTWWLTDESRILKLAENVIQKYNAGFMMRPEFLIKFFSLSPNTSDVRKTYREIFPSKLGIKLARRVPSEELDKVLEKANDAARLEEGRREAEISMIIDSLKSDFTRAY